MSPYVGMARKQNGGYNASISVQTLIFHLVVNSTRLVKTVRSALWRCPNSTVALRFLENVVKVTNLEVVKIVFRHLPFLILLLLILQGIKRLCQKTSESCTQCKLRALKCHGGSVTGAAKYSAYVNKTHAYFGCKSLISVYTRNLTRRRQQQRVFTRTVLGSVIF